MYSCTAVARRRQPAKAQKGDTILPQAGQALGGARCALGRRTLYTPRLARPAAAAMSAAVAGRGRALTAIVGLTGSVTVASYYWNQFLGPNLSGCSVAPLPPPGRPRAQRTGRGLANRSIPTASSRNDSGKWAFSSTRCASTAEISAENSDEQSAEECDCVPLWECMQAGEGGCERLDAELRACMQREVGVASCYTSMVLCPDCHLCY